MPDNKYAVVAYLPGKLGVFVDGLRRRFDPALAAWLPHVTILPPRPLLNPMDGPLHTIRRQSALFSPFDANIQGPATFWPVSGVVYLSFSAGSERLTRLHDSLNKEELAHTEIHSYIPHITIAQELDEMRMQAVLADVSEEWRRFGAEASFRVESLFLVQHTPENRWIDLAPVQLGGVLSPTS